MAAARTEKSFSLEAAAAASRGRGERSEKILAKLRKTQRTSSGRGLEKRFAKSCREKRVAESLFAKPRAASVTEGFSETHTPARARSSDIPGPVVSSEPLRLHARLSLSGNAARFLRAILQPNLCSHPLPAADCSPALADSSFSLRPALRRSA